MDSFKVIIEEHDDGFVAYPLGLKGVIVAQGDTYDEALREVSSAIRFHMETFGEEVFDAESPVIDAFIAETSLVAS